MSDAAQTLIKDGKLQGDLDCNGFQLKNITLSIDDFNVQPLDSDLTAISALSTTAFGRALLALADAAAVRAYIGAGSSSAAISSTSAILKGDGAGSAVTSGITPTVNAVGFSLAGGTTPKTLKVDNNIEIAGSDGAAINVGAGGTLGTAAFTAATAYEVPVTVVAPIVRTTNALSIPRSSGAVNGYLHQDDFNTFNNKEPAVSGGANTTFLRGDKTMQPVPFTDLTFNGASLNSIVGTPTDRGLVNNISISVKTAGGAGTGTPDDPFDGSTAAKFDAILASQPTYSTINLEAGTFKTGVHDSNLVNYKTGWKIIGSGKGVTTIKLDDAISLASRPFETLIFCSALDTGADDATISNLTLDCNWGTLANTAPDGVEVRHFTGSVSSGSDIITGTGFSSDDLGLRVTGTGVASNSWIGQITDSTHAKMSTSAVSYVTSPATGNGSGTYTLKGKNCKLEGANLCGSNINYENVEVVNTYGSVADSQEHTALGFAGKTGVRGDNNWMLNCVARLPWGNYGNPFAVSYCQHSGVKGCHGYSINDGETGRGFTTGGVNAADLVDCEFSGNWFYDCLILYCDTNALDGVTISGNHAISAKSGISMVAAGSGGDAGLWTKKRVKIFNNTIELQNRVTGELNGIKTSGDTASSLVCSGNIITLVTTGNHSSGYTYRPFLSTSLSGATLVNNTVDSGGTVTVTGTGIRMQGNRDATGSIISGLEDTAQETVSTLVAVGSPVSLTTATATNIASVSLTAGSWDICGNVNFNESSATVTARSASINTTSGTNKSDGTECYLGTQTTTTSEINSIILPKIRMTLAITTIVYLIGKITFSAGTVGAFGSISATRVQ